MKPFGEFFEIMLNSCCAFLGVNNNDFFEFCFDTFHAKHESKIGSKLDSLTNNAKHIMSNGLALSLGITGILDRDFPGLNKKIAMVTILMRPAKDGIGIEKWGKLTGYPRLKKTCSSAQL